MHILLICPRRNMIKMKENNKKKMSMTITRRFITVMQLLSKKRQKKSHTHTHTQTHTHIYPRIHTITPSPTHPHTHPPTHSHTLSLSHTQNTYQVPPTLLQVEILESLFATKFAIYDDNGTDFCDLKMRACEPGVRTRTGLFLLCVRVHVRVRV